MSLQHSINQHFLHQQEHCCPYAATLLLLGWAGQAQLGVQEVSRAVKDEVR